MQKTAHHTYSFDEFTLDLTRGCLRRGGVELKLRPKSFDVLKSLVENSGRLVSKDELIESVWQGMAVTDDSLVQCMKEIRRVLGDDRQTIIKTVPRRGYVFEIEVNEIVPPVYFEEASGIKVVIEESDDHIDRIDKNSSQPKWKAVTRSLVDIVKLHKWAAASAVSLSILIAVGAGFGLFVYLRRPPVSPFKSVNIERRLTSEGNAATTAISPDGKYLAFVIDDGGLQSLWIRQVAAAKNIQIIAAANVKFSGVTFSPDSNFIYYIEENVLYQTATLGGSTRKLRDGVSTAVTFSPDGQRLAFIRLGAGDGQGTRLVAVNADGTGDEQVIAYRKPPDAFTLAGCAWSPDGATIICSAGDNQFFGQEFPLAVSVADGRQAPLTSKRWNTVGQTAWLPDGTGFLMTAFDSLDADSQIWHVSFPGGVPVKIYDDLNGYLDLSLSANSKTFVSIQRQPRLNIQALDLYSQQRQAKQLTFDTDGSNGWECVTTTPENRIVYYSEAGAAGDLWVMDSDGQNQRQLTDDDQMESSANVSPDGRQIAYSVSSDGIWTIDMDGGNRRQLAQFGMFPFYSADGDWIFYTVPRERWSMWKISTVGGKPIRLTERQAIQPAVSPDGKLIAFMEVRPLLGTNKLKIVPIDGGDPIRVIDIFDLAGLFDLEWLPDGSAVAYNAYGNGLQEIVSQPIDGGASQVLVAAKSEAESVRAFAFSHDGKQLFYTAGPTSQNVVLFQLDR